MNIVSISPYLYGYILLFASSVLSAIIQDIPWDFIEKRQDGNEHSANGGLKRWGIKYILFYVLVYFAVCFISVFFYSVCHQFISGANVLTVFTGMLSYYLASNFIIIIAIPAIVSFVKWIMQIWSGAVSLKIKIVVSAVAAVLIIISPLLITHNIVSDLPMEEEILTELRTMEFPYETRVFNGEHMLDCMEEGYWTEDNPKPADSGNNNRSTRNNNKRAPRKDISRMTFAELVYAADYYYNNNQVESARVYLEKAYEIYQSQGEDAIGDWYSIGCMFYYMSHCEMGNYYEEGVKAFLKGRQYKNALFCYRDNLIGTEVIDERTRISREMLKLWPQILDAGENSDYVVNIIESAYIKSINEGYSKLDDELNAVCERNIDSPLLQTLNIANHVSAGNYGDGEKLVKLLQNPKYASCPKLMILNNVYRLKSGEEYSCEPIYKLYIAYPKYFEKEDRINLVWLLYKSGEYIKTYEVSDEPESIKESNNKSENSIDYQMLLIRTESYIQNSSLFSDVDEVGLYKDITNKLKQMGIDPETNESEEKKLISNLAIARLKLVRCILAGRIGVDVSYSGLSEVCEELFNTGSKTGLYIVAYLYHQDGADLKALEFCNQIESMTDTQDDFQNKVLLLKADTMIALASRPDIEENKKKSLYDEAERILDNVRKQAKNDYIVSSQRLADLYESTGRYDDAHQIREDLMKFQQMRVNQ